MLITRPEEGMSGRMMLQTRRTKKKRGPYDEFEALWNLRSSHASKLAFLQDMCNIDSSLFVKDVSCLYAVYVGCLGISPERLSKALPVPRHITCFKLHRLPTSFEMFVVRFVNVKYGLYMC